VLNASKTEKKINKKTGRLAQHFQCNICKQDFPQTQIQMDHIEPVVDPKVGFVNWDTYIERMFCPEDNLQAICKACHQIKTNKEKKERVK
jgi:5-methylcytosine-specific restriction endonuclease McrA